MFTKIFINPIELEYVQFTMSNKDQVRNEVSSHQMNIYPSYDELGEPCLIIPTVNGELTCNVGDYIIKDPNPKDCCKFICCTEQVFKKLMSIFDSDL